MNYVRVLEKADNFVYYQYNILARIAFGFKPGIRKRLKKNLCLKDSHRGERCFVVLNGPSINNYDLRLLQDEITICTNFFYRSELVDIIRPDYYCWSDGIVFEKQNEYVLKELLEKCPYSQFFFGSKALKIQFLEQYDNVHVTYNKLRTREGYISSNLNSISTNFGTVAIYAINVAIFLGFKEIYLLGYDFPPGTFLHFGNLGKTIAEENKEFAVSKDKVCGSYRGYLCAQYDNYYMSEHAKRNGVSIFNCNSSSYVRSYQFVDFKDVMGTDKE